MPLPPTKGSRVERGAVGRWSQRKAVSCWGLILVTCFIAFHMSQVPPSTTPSTLAIGRYATSEMYIATGANSKYFGGLKNLVGSIHYFSPRQKIVVCHLWPKCYTAKRNMKVFVVKQTGCI